MYYDYGVIKAEECAHQLSMTHARMTLTTCSAKEHMAGNFH